MIRKKKFLLYLLGVVSMMLLAFISMFIVFSGNLSIRAILSNFFLNLPAWIIMGLIDILILEYRRKKIPIKSGPLDIGADLLIANTVIISIVILCMKIIRITYDQAGTEFEKFAIPLIICNSVIILFIEVYIYTQSKGKAEKKIALMEKQKIQHQFEILKAQLNPHFLFNSLNVLASLTFQDASTANKFAKKLSSVYRYLLKTNNSNTVKVRDELSFLEAYIYLEQIRFKDSFKLIMLNQHSYLENNIIPASLQILVENAIKHNIATEKHPLEIQVEFLPNIILVKNKKKLRTNLESEGVGLSNLKQQYLLFNELLKVEENDFEFIVSIPYIQLSNKK